MSNNSQPSPLRTEELAYEPLDVAPWRRNLSNRIVAGTVGLSRWLNRHWLMVANGFNLLILVGTFATPLLKAIGWDSLSSTLYSLYSLICLQRPSHSFFLADFQMGMEIRMVAIYVGFVAAGVAFVAWPGSTLGQKSVLTRLTSWQVYLLLSLPMLLDVFSQTLGLRESNWVWRSSTGFLFGVATVWYFYAHFRRISAHLENS